MTIQEILDRVSEYHPDLGEDYHGCDEVKFVIAHRNAQELFLHWFRR